MPLCGVLPGCRRCSGGCLWGSSWPAGGPLISPWGPPGLQGVPLYLCGVLLASRGRPNGTVGSLCPPSLQGAPLYLCGVLPGCRGCSDACLWGSSWPAGGALMGQWGLLCPPGLQGVPLYHFGVLLACRGRPYITLGSSRPAGGALISLWDPPGLHCL